MPDQLLDLTELEVFNIMTHELAHQWFGNTVTLRTWTDIWLNEGFATYTEWIARAERFGAQSAIAARSSSEQTLISDRRVTPLFAPDPGEMFGIATYDKGAWVLHMLRAEIGDEAFFALLRRYLVTFADRPVDTLDFWRLAEEISGQDLAWFFEQWVMQPGGLPRYALYWTETAAGADILLCPTGPGAYRLNLPLHFAGSGEEDVTLLVEGEPVRASFDLSFAPSQVSADPDQMILAQVQTQAIAALPEGCPQTE
jgi:hypothetical protein